MKKALRDARGGRLAVPSPTTPRPFNYCDPLLPATLQNWLKFNNQFQYLNNHSIADCFLTVNMAYFSMAVLEAKRLNFLMYCLNKQKTIYLAYFCINSNKHMAKSWHCNNDINENVYEAVTMSLLQSPYLILTEYGFQINPVQLNYECTPTYKKALLQAWYSHI